MFLAIPNLSLAAPRDCNLLALLLRNMLDSLSGSVGIRYPRGQEPSLRFPCIKLPAPGAGQIVRQGADVLLIAVGTFVSTAYEAAEMLASKGIDVLVYDPIWLKPAPVEKITELAVNRFVVTLEEGSVCGGFGQYVASVLPDKQVSILGIPDKFVSHGSTADILNSLGLDSIGIAKSVEEKFRLRSNIEIN